MTTAIRKARQRARKAEKGEKEIRFYASPKAQEWAKQEFPDISIHELARAAFEGSARGQQDGGHGWEIEGASTCGPNPNNPREH